jgi:hypothetical protein
VYVVKNIYLYFVDGILEHYQGNVSELSAGTAVTVYGTNNGSTCLPMNVAVVVDDTVLTL